MRGFLERIGMWLAPLIILGVLLGVRYNLKASDEYIRGRIVRLSDQEGMCSGVQIHSPSGVNYVLTAGHCSIMGVEGTIAARSADGRQYKLKIIEEDPFSDLLLLSGIPNMVGISVATHSPIYPTHIRTFTHGNDYDTFKTEGELVQDHLIQIVVGPVMSILDALRCTPPKNSIQDGVCVLTVQETISTALIVQGSSGGPAVDDRGSVVGIVSASNAPFSCMVKLTDIQRFMKRF